MESINKGEFLFPVPIKKKSIFHRKIFQDQFSIEGTPFEKTEKIEELKQTGWLSRISKEDLELIERERENKHSVKMGLALESPEPFCEGVAPFSIGFLSKNGQWE